MVAVASPGPQAGCFCPCRAAGAPSSVTPVAAPGPRRCPQPCPERLLICESLLGQNSCHLSTAVSSQSLPPPRSLSLSVSLKSCIFLFIHFWLCWVSLAARAFPSCGERGCSPRWLPFLRSRGSRAGPVVVAQGQRCSTTRGVFPGQGSNPCLLHWQVDSLPLSHQGSPPCYFKRKKGTAPSSHACGIQPTHYSMALVVFTVSKVVQPSPKSNSRRDAPHPRAGSYPPALDTTVCFLSLWVCPFCTTYVDRRRQYQPFVSGLSLWGTLSRFVLPWCEGSVPFCD